MHRVDLLHGRGAPVDGDVIERFEYVPNGIINNEDFFYYLTIFSAGC